ncbi:MAG: hypothetical protein PHS71_04810 [Proteiniphilum sp.]|nr:hypothetical protein [Proteiniphilum sp.]
MKKLWVVCSLMAVSLLARGVEETAPMSLDISIDYSNDPFFLETWFWAVAGIFFLSILLLLIRSGKTKRKQSQPIRKDAEDHRNAEKKAAG